MRPRATILVKLLAALVLPTVALFTVFAFVAYEVSRRDLDEELGRRLEAIAASASTQIRGKYLDLVQDGENKWQYRDPASGPVIGKLETFANATGAQLSLFDRKFDARGDSEGNVAIGTPDFRAKLDRNELARVFERGETASSVTFEGKEDGKIYKAGYAPVRASYDDPTIVLAIRAQAPASYFARLADLRDRLFVWGAGLMAVSILAAVLSTLLITRNVRRLAAAAERIGAGELRERVQISSNDELGLLAQTMDRMRQQLADRDARTQQMLAGIAHEVRNPLAGMTLFASILRDELPEGDERRSHVDKIQRELGYLERVVNDFLEYARRPKPELALASVHELLAEVAQLASSDVVAIEVEPVTPPQLEVRADRGQLRRAILNLANNAVQAAGAAGHHGPGAVKLAARRRGDELHFEVWNRGKEISPESSGKLFEPFFTTREKGTGLGLAFVREIAVDHGGRVDIASANGETTFTLVVPA
ncbi:MAG: integral rane sensor signal transduction histidine kinase [Deltaproteobacteria bacterium]|nr:integral rane sensor signal transduction histidine kinase [Deltaproteobacteria bacterium]